MKKFYIACCMVIPLISFSQLTEPTIPFFLDTDGDTIINVIDNDDDNDGVTDNLDLYPLDNTRSGPTILSSVVNADGDAGLRNNTAGNANTNYGTDATVQTSNINRNLIVRFIQPANLDITMATLTLWSGTENDSLVVYWLPYYNNSNTWVENTITYNTTNFTGKQLLGTTATPVAGKYTFNIPTNIFPTTGGAFTLLIYDANDPNGNTETLLTKETAGKTATVDFNYKQAITPRIVVNQFAGTQFYLNGGIKQIGFKLSQAPTATVYLPLEISDTGKAKIIGDKVLSFDAGNWNVFQNLQVQPFGLGTFNIAERPLHSNDTYFNGNNPADLLNYTIQATNISNLTTYTIPSGSTFTTTLIATSAVGSTKFAFRILSGPTGLGIVENSGVLNFTPLSNQVGTHTIVLEVKDDKGNVSQFTTNITVTASGTPDPTGIYVIPNAPADALANGTVAHPYNDIAVAVTAAGTAGGGNVFIRGGEYEMTSPITISTVGSPGNPIMIKPSLGENVKLNFALLNLFTFDTTARFIELTGIEIDGGTDNVDFWCLPAQAFWGNQSIFRGGGLAIIVDGDYITVRGNYIHNCYQKAVEIRRARYLKVYDNIVHSIANTSLSGGHGIMRQQAGGEIFTDDLDIYRWDLMGNMIFNVEQRIYSWVPSKGSIEMVLDEGKPILIDDPKDTDGHQEKMKARIKDNVVAFGSLDHIRLKSTPNLEVSNNSVYTAATTADGITDKGGDTPTPQFTNFKFLNNAIQTQPGRTAVDIVDAISQANANPGGPTVYGNKVVGGNILPNGQAGVNTLATTQLYVDANNGNFRLNPALALPDSIGANPLTLNAIDEKTTKFGVTVKWDQWPNDHLKLTQTILDNIPGINDGITGNDTVFTDFGTMNGAQTNIHFNVVNGTWKSRTGSPGSQDFHLNENYTAWYHRTDSMYKNAGGGNYERIRWGNSVLKQNQLFDNDWLTVSQITSNTTNTVITGEDKQFTLDGDLLIDFENFTPAAGDSFYLMKAGTITSQNSGSLFDRVLFEGYTPANYTLTIVNIPGGQAVQLKIIDGCVLTVSNTNDAGTGSLRAAIACAIDGDIITLASSLENDTIKLTSTALVINKNIFIISQKKAIYVQNKVNAPIEISISKSVALTNFNILSDQFTNKGMLVCTDMSFASKTGLSNILFTNEPGANTRIINDVKIK